MGKRIICAGCRFAFRIAEIFEVSVSEILGAKFDDGNDINVCCRSMSRINEQLAIKNRRSHVIWKNSAIFIGAIITLNIILVILGMMLSFNH